MSLRWRDCRPDTLPDDNKDQVLWLKVLGKHSQGGEREDGCGNPIACQAFLKFQSLRHPKGVLVPDEHVFLHHHRDGFRELLLEAGLRTTQEEQGRLRNLKSLRPTGISLLLNETDSPSYRQVAKWARTSASMVEDFYDQTHPEETATQLMGKGKPKKSGVQDKATSERKAKTDAWLKFSAQILGASDGRIKLTKAFVDSFKKVVNDEVDEPVEI
jgi:hypothetical protein